jgi:hypothetical protein
MKRILTLLFAAIILTAAAFAAESDTSDTPEVRGTLEKPEYVTDFIVVVTTHFAQDTSGRLNGNYSGPLVGGIPHGSGILVHPGAVEASPQTAQWYYEGEFRNGTFHGWGTVWIRGEIAFTGELAFGNWVTPCIDWSPEWHAINNPTAGTLERPLYVTDFDITITKNGSNVNGQFRGWYSGPLVDGLPHGHGVFAPLGDRNPSPQNSRWYYEGEFRAGLFHGQGRYYRHGELLHGGEFRDGDSAGWTSTTTILLILIVAGVLIIIFTIIGIVCHCKPEIAAKAALGLNIELNIEESADDDSQPAQIVRVHCSGCATPTNVQIGKSEICDYCGSAVNAEVRT